MAKLILGPSGAGKSTLINTKSIKSENLIFGYELINKRYGLFKFWKKNKKITNDSIIHYNILDSFARQTVFQDEKVILQNDKILKKILSHNNVLDEVIILVAPIRELISRAITREKIENNILGNYDSKFWLNLIQKTNFYNLYKELFIILDTYNIKYQILYSSLNNFKVTQKNNVNKNLDGFYE